MVVSTQTHSHAFATPLAFLARFGAKAHAGLKALQMARMLSTLYSMSDHQLAQIGVSRSDIPKYAETLMAED